MPLPTSVRELDDDSIAFLLEAYIDRAGTGDPLVPPPPALTALCAALYGPGRSGPGGDADDDRRVWKHVCAKLGLAALPAYAGAPTTWKAAFAALRAEVSQLSDDGRTNFRRVVRRNPYSYELLREASRDGHALVVAVILRAATPTPSTQPMAPRLRRSWLRAAAATRYRRRAAPRRRRRCAYQRSGYDALQAVPHVDVVQALLAANADVDARGDQGEQALIVACQDGHPERPCLAAGAQVNIHTGPIGGTALSVASGQGQLEARPDAPRPWRRCACPRDGGHRNTALLNASRVGTRTSSRCSPPVRRSTSATSLASRR